MPDKCGAPSSCNAWHSGEQITGTNKAGRQPDQANGTPKPEDKDKHGADALAVAKVVLAVTRVAILAVPAAIVSEVNPISQPAAAP